MVASADATLAVAETGGVQTESEIGEIFLSFKAELAQRVKAGKSSIYFVWSALRGSHP